MSENKLNKEEESKKKSNNDMNIFIWIIISKIIKGKLKEFSNYLLLYLY